MGNRIFKSILWLLLFMPFMVSAHTSITSSSYEGCMIPLPILAEEFCVSTNSPVQNFVLRHKQKAPDGNSDAIQYAHIVLSESGTLSSALGDRIFEIDSISVEGPMNEEDFNTLWDSSFNGSLKIINLENAAIENGKIPDYAFFHIDVQVDWDTWIITVTPLEKIILPDYITEIGKDAFGYAINLVEINFPSKLRYIGKSAFTDCISLKPEMLVFPKGLEKLDEQAFYQCRGLDGEIKLPSTLTWIDASVFYNCRIAEINIPDNLEYLGCFAFAGSRFKKAILPDDCYLCHHGCQFYNNWELTEAHLPENSLFVPPQVFDGCIKLTKANVPSQAIVIGEFAYNSTSLSAISFPPTLERIEQDAFQGCDGMESILLPASLTALGDRAFNCYGLKAVYCMAQTPPEFLASQGYESDRNPFAGVDTSIPVYIPVGTKERYLAAPGWDYFTNFIETDNFPSAGIENISPDVTPTSYKIYDLSGRQTEALVSGHIYIRNGKKFIHK